MQYRVLGRTGIRASAVAFGGIIVTGMEKGLADSVVASAVELGVNYFDVAPSYGNAQYVLGPALAPHRKQVALACKSAEKTAEGVTRELEESLRACKTDWFDVYQLHSCDEDFDTVFGPSGAMEAILKARDAGKVRFIGFSSHRERSALYLMSQFDFDTIMQPVNWSNNAAIGKSDLAMKLAEQKGMGRIGIKALAHRPLADGEEGPFKTCWYRPIVGDEHLAELALKFALARVHTAVSPGAAPMLELMLRFAEEPGLYEPLSEGDLAYLKAEAAKVKALFPD